jgi:hypothetical protein
MSEELLQEKSHGMFTALDQLLLPHRLTLAHRSDLTIEHDEEQNPRVNHGSPARSS